MFILRELAVAMPTYFYQQISTFFDHIFNAIFDPKPAIRESAGGALRAALIVTSQRENTKQMTEPQWYKNCYSEGNKNFVDELNPNLNILKETKGMTRDDRVHGSMIIINELLRCSNITWERRYNTLKILLPEALALKLGDGLLTNSYLNNNNESSYSIIGGGIGASYPNNQMSTIMPKIKVPFVKKTDTKRFVYNTTIPYYTSSVAGTLTSTGPSSPQGNNAVNINIQACIYFSINFDFYLCPSVLFRII